MNRTMKLSNAAALSIVMVTGACWFSPPAKADVAAAEATYKTKCAGCHGADAKGKEALKTRDLSSADVQKQSDADLTTIITAGKGKMPPYGKSLKPEQVADLVAYIRSLAKK